jgi:hypothetical protein
LYEQYHAGREEMSTQPFATKREIGFWKNGRGWLPAVIEGMAVGADNVVSLGELAAAVVAIASVMRQMMADRFALTHGDA